MCALALAACTETAREIVPLDLDPPAASAALGLIRDGQLTVYALDGDGTGAAALPTFPAFAEDRPLDLVLYAYDAPLAALGIPPGLLPADRSGGALPSPARRGLRRVDADGPGAWLIEVDEVDARLDAFRSPALPRSPCLELTTTTVELVGAADPIVALLPDGDGVLALTGTPIYDEPGDGELWRVSGGASPQATRLDVPSLAAVQAGGPMVAAARGRDGRIWISVGGKDRVIPLFVGTVAGGFRELPRSPESPQEWVWWMLPEPHASGPRLWALTDFGNLHRFDEATQTWTRLVGGSTPGLEDCVSPTLRCGGLGQSPDGTIVVADPRTQRHVLRVDGDRMVEEPLPPVADPLTAVASTPLGVVVVRSSQLSTSFARRDPSGRWSLLTGETGSPAFMTQRTFATIGFRDGFVASGRFGFVHQRVGERSCPPLGGVAPNAVVAYLAELPDGLALAHGWASDTGPLPARVFMAREVR